MSAVYGLAQAAGRRSMVVLPAMALGLALFYRGGHAALQLAGLLLYGGLALLRPDLALIFVPLSVPLFLIPVPIGGLRGGNFRLPLHEVALLIVLGASLVRWLLAIVRGISGFPSINRDFARHYLPHGLLLLAGLIGVLLALPEGRGAALRELRWLILEPLAFYALLLIYRESGLRLATRAMILGGALVGLIGILQYAGIDLVPLLGEKQSFSENIVEAGGVSRVASVYGHPNNLGLYLGRIWPLAAVLALQAWRRQRSPAVALLAITTLLCLAGIGVSFSRGAWLGAVAALATLLIGLRTQETRSWMPGGRWIVLTLLALAITAGLAFMLRGGILGGSTDVRTLLWREALGYLQAHPFGIGLDQFLYYHDPQSGRSLIDPALVHTSERYAAHPHNLLLDTWLRVGPIGILAFAWLLALFFRATITRPTWLAIGARAAMVAALVHGMVDNFYFVPDLAFAFWMLLAITETPEEPIQRES